MKKKIMSLSCLMAAAALAGCSAAAPAAASEETTTPETSEMTPTCGRWNRPTALMQ